MESVTKNRQNSDTIRKMADKIFSPLKLKDYKELTEGYFNIAYEAELSNGMKTILKIAPSKEVKVMTYERNIMYSEVQAMKIVKEKCNVPVAEVYGYDDSCTICSSPYFFMEKINGKSLNSIKETLTPRQIDNIYCETGRIIRSVNSISCPCFGYPGQPDYQGSNWYSVFYKMIEALLEDAKLVNADIKISPDELIARLQRDKAAFEEVTEPHFVHWDCWDGNIFVENGKITGIIDWERVLWADPLMEVGFRTYAPNSGFQKGYGITALNERQQRRALWYDIYLMLTMIIECDYRKYETMDQYNWTSDTIVKQFGKLNQVS